MRIRPYIESKDYAQLVQLNVFNENVAAKRCYEKLGFIEESITKDAFPFKNEFWSRCHMIIPKSKFV